MVAHKSVDRNPKHCGHVAWLGQLWLSCRNLCIYEVVDNNADEDHDDADDDDENRVVV